MTVIRQTYLRKEAARNCKVHSDIMTRAVNELVRVGVFSKEAVLDATGYSAISDSIRWDYIREFIQDDKDTELIPLAQSYFKRHKEADEKTNPQRYIAQGNGKKTAGYASVVPGNDHLVIRRLEQRKAISDGVVGSYHDLRKRVNDKREQHGLPPVRDHTVLS